jgi:hypothetical protein
MSDTRRDDNRDLAAWMDSRNILQKAVKGLKERCSESEGRCWARFIWEGGCLTEQHNSLDTWSPGQQLFNIEVVETQSALT